VSPPIRSPRFGPLRLQATHDFPSVAKTLFPSDSPLFQPFWRPTDFPLSLLAALPPHSERLNGRRSRRGSHCRQSSPPPPPRPTTAGSRPLRHLARGTPHRPLRRLVSALAYRRSTLLPVRDTAMPKGVRRRGRRIWERDETRKSSVATR
jgi:hypothetical protein